MYESTANGNRKAPTGARVQIVKRRRARKEVPDLDLRTPSGKRTLPY
jgi:hypothetical protein